jgi:polysaccharide export outer membrane protein
MRILTQAKILFLFFALAGTAQCARAADYLLGAGDSIHVQVYEHDDLTTDDRISDNAHITFPLLGEVNIAGMRTVAAAAYIGELLTQKKLVKNPLVTIKVVESASQQVSVLGQVNKPGKYKIQAKATLLEIVAEAGGISATGDDHAIIVRNEGGESRRFEVSLGDMLERGLLSQNITLERQDVIYVPRAPQFYVFGEVQRPGVYRLERGMTVLQALAVGGGLSQRGTAKGVKISRRSADGLILSVDVGPTDVLLPDDVVIVKERLF